VICGAGDRVAAVSAREGVPCYTVDLRREVSAASDARALLELVRLLRRLAPDIVNASTPKAALLGLCAARLARVPHRIYLARGLRLETLRPLVQLGMRQMERLCATLAERVVCVSPSLRALYLEQRLAPAAKCVVLGAGSSNGIDIERFSPSAELDEQALALGVDLGLDRSRPTLGFVGRPVADKGIAELWSAYRRARAAVPGIQLLMVGAGFAGDAECAEMSELRATPGVFVVPAVSDVAPYYRLMNVLVFPSYREGFPNVVLEASAMGLPVVGFDATGVRDAIVDGVTGTVCPMRDAGALAAAAIEYLNDTALASRHGSAGAERARREFERERVWGQVVEFYRDLLTPRGPAPGSRASEHPAGGKSASN
jgi:glycosyltransferase involved in cell wall biosynthesis